MEVKSESNVRAVVAVVRCSSYDQATVDLAVKRGIDLLGGTGAFASGGERILFKPNVLSGTDPAKCIVTHPSIVRSVIAEFSMTGAVLSYGDSSAGLPNPTMNMRKCGYPDVLQSLPVELVSFEESCEVVYPQGIAGKRLRIAKAVENADGIINLPKLKTHGLTRMTGAVKNCYGCIPGATKGDYHARFPDVYDFSNLLADIATCIRPRLHVMDAVEAMEGNGARNGTPKHLGVLLFSTDPVALDTVACRLINLNPDHVPTIAAGVLTGLGTANPEHIDLAGDSVEELIDATFDVVRMAPVRFRTDGVFRFLRQFFLPRPVIKSRQCTRCGRCETVCPVFPKALCRNSATKPPVYNYKLCIRCYCCQEVCPSNAIAIRKPAGARLLPYMAYLSLFFVNRRVRRRA